MECPISLQKVSGLSDEDPIYSLLGLIDDFFKCEYSWDVIHQKVQHECLLEALFKYTGYPFVRCDFGEPWVKENDDITEQQILDFKDFLVRNDENHFANLVSYLLSSKVNFYEIRLVLSFIFVNLEDLRSREKKPRCIFSGNVVDGPFL